MPRRALLAASLALLVPFAAGCGGAPTGPQQQRAAFLERHKKLKDAELAAVCPSLYPSDFLRDPKKYRYDKADRGYKPSARERADARSIGCTTRGTKPKD